MDCKQCTSLRCCPEHCCDVGSPRFIVVLRELGVAVACARIATCGVRMLVQWGDCSCGDCGMCGGTAPVDRLEPDKPTQKSKGEEPVGQPVPAQTPGGRTDVFKPSRDIFADIEARVKRTMEAERKVARVFYRNACGAGLSAVVVARRRARSEKLPEPLNARRNASDTKP
jgi:hypothetical protein